MNVKKSCESPSHDFHMFSEMSVFNELFLIICLHGSGWCAELWRFMQKRFSVQKKKNVTQSRQINFTKDIHPKHTHGASIH